MSALIRLALVLCFSAPAFSATLQEADAFFEMEQYAEAKAIYEKLVKSGGDTGAHATYRKAESEVYLQRFAEAAQFLNSAAIPKSSVWRNRLLFLRTQVYEQYLLQYGWKLNDVTVAGSADITQRSALDWEKEITKDFAALWAERAKLSATPLSGEAPFIKVKDSDAQKFPNVWTFVVGRWVRFLDGRSSSKAKVPFPAGVFEAAGNWNRQAPRALQAAALLESAAASNAAAKPLWQAEKWLLPLTQTSWFEPAPKTLMPFLKKLNDKMDGLNDKRAKAMLGAMIATHYGNEKEINRGIALCKLVEKWDAQSPASQTCVSLRSRWQQPEIGVNALPLLPEVTQTIDVTSRNLGTLYFRWLPVSFDRLKSQRSAGNENGYYFLKTIELELLKTLVKEKAAFAWKITPVYPQAHEETKSKVSVPPTKAGFHVLLASENADFDPGKGLIRGALVRVSPVALVGSASPLKNDALTAVANETNPHGGFHVYAIDGKTGEPKAGWSISARQRLNWNSSSEVSQSTDEKGRAQFTSFPESYQSLSLDPLLKRDTTFALLESPLNLYKTEQDNTRIFLDLDRPIYRQGQKVKFKVTAFERAYPGWKWRTGGEVELVARNASGKDFYKTKVSLSPRASVAGEFTLPDNGMLGGWTLEASLKEKSRQYSLYKSFLVEAYQRPELELTFEKGKDGKDSAPCRYTKPCEATGKAVTYAGTPLPGRAVTYKITREPYYPFWGYWWRSPHREGAEEITSGTVLTTKDGSFRVPFVPKAYEDGEGSARFTINAETRELGGRTITATHQILAGAHAFQIRAEAATGFVDDTTSSEWTLSLEGLNGEQSSGEVEYALYSLKAATEPKDAEGLEPWLQNQKNDQTVLQGRAKVDAKATPLKLTRVASGIYRLSLKTRDAWGGTVESHRPLVVVSAKGEVSAKTMPPALALAVKKKLQVGDTADTLLGSGVGRGPNFVEVWQGRNLIAVQTLPPGIQRFRYPVTEKARGGVTVRWFSLFANQLFQGNLSLEVPWTDREIKLTWKLPASTEPGTTVELPLQAVTQEGQPIAGEGILRVTDRALEYYAANEKLGVHSLFPSEPAPEPLRDSHFISQGSWLPTPPGWLEAKLGITDDARKVKPRQEPTFPFEEMRGGYASYGGGSSKGVRMRGAAPMEMLADANSSAEAAPMATRAQVGKAKNAEHGGADPQQSEVAAPVTPRSDFTETAAFLPALEFKGGQASATLKFPDSLTSWKAEAFVSSADGRVGYVTANLSTQKPLTVELALTRFLREGDRAEFKGVLYNNTVNATAGKAIFRILRQGETKALTEKTFPVSLPAHGQNSIPLPIDSSLTLGDYVLEFSYRDGALADGVKKEISLLPSRQVLVASDVALLEGDSKTTLTTTKLGKDAMLKSTTLAIEPNLALSVLGALPSLSNPPALCLDGLLNRYVPLVAVQKLFTDHPELKKAAEILRKENPNRHAWDLNDPRRLLSAQESPWALEAEGKGTEAGLDLLDAKLVDKLSASTREGIKGYQKPEGAFSWFPGGPNDLYMTLIALADFVEAHDLGVPFDEDSQKRAAAFLMKSLSEAEKPTELRLTLKLYAAYVISALSEHYDWAKSYTPTLERWLADTDKARSGLTPIGRAYAARALFHLGKTEKANAYLNRVLSDAVEDPITGLSWRLEETSWLWYHDSLDKHLFVLRTLLKMRPTDPKITSLVRGLFWQKKGNKWKSARHSAGAVLAMVAYLKNAGAFTKSVTASWSWGGDKGKNTWEPLDPKEKQLVITQKDPASNYLSAQVEKTGPGFAVASLTTLFESSTVTEGQGSLLSLKRNFFLRQKRKGQDVLQPLKIGDSVKVGDIVEVEMTLKARSQFEYLHLKSPRGAGFEPENRLSGWKWDGVSRYQEIKDSLDQIFISWMPNGTYRFRFPLRATIGGKFNLQSALVQSMYSPDISSFTESGELSITQ